MAIATAPRRTYAQRADAITTLINSIASLNANPHHFHETRDAAARAARALATSLRVDGI
jgi:hypothetical protein